MLFTSIKLINTISTAYYTKHFGFNTSCNKECCKSAMYYVYTPSLSILSLCFVWGGEGGSCSYIDYAGYDIPSSHSLYCTLQRSYSLHFTQSHYIQQRSTCQPYSKAGQVQFSQTGTEISALIYHLYIEPYHTACEQQVHCC